MRKTGTGTRERLKEQLAKLGEFSSAFDGEGFKFGELCGGEPDPEGIAQWPYFVLSNATESFHQHRYEHGWVLNGFDWPGWTQSAEAIDYETIGKSWRKGPPNNWPSC